MLIGLQDKNDDDAWMDPFLKYPINEMHRKRWWSYVAVATLMFLVLLILAHARAYFNVPSGGSQLLQAWISDVTPEILSERQPIILMDELAVPDHQSFLKTSLRCQHISSRLDKDVSQGFTSARFTLISCFIKTASTVSIIAPRDGGSIIINLSRGRTLVLPPRWKWSSSVPCTVTSAHDPFTMLFSSIVHYTRP